MTVCPSPHLSNNCAPTPLEVLGLSGVVAVAAGYSHSLALTWDGTLWAWGLNESGQLGNKKSGPGEKSLTPIRVEGLSGVVAIAAGTNHSLALTRDGTLWAWGYNFYGQLGSGKPGDSSIPVPVKEVEDLSGKDLSGVVAIAAGASHSLAVTWDGTLWAWGRNDFGQLGNSTLTQSSTAAPVKEDVRAAGWPDEAQALVAGGEFHTLAVLADGTMAAWGSNGWGQLGIETQSLPEPVLWGP